MATNTFEQLNRAIEQIGLVMDRMISVSILPHKIVMGSSTDFELPNLDFCLLISAKDEVQRDIESHNIQILDTCVEAYTAYATGLQLSCDFALWITIPKLSPLPPVVEVAVTDPVLALRRIVCPIQDHDVVGDCRFGNLISQNVFRGHSRLHFRMMSVVSFNFVSKNIEFKFLHKGQLIQLVLSFSQVDSFMLVSGLP